MYKAHTEVHLWCLKFAVAAATRKGDEGFWMTIGALPFGPSEISVDLPRKVTIDTDQ